MSEHMVIFGVTWDVEKSLSAGDPLVGLGVGTLERGKNGSSINETGTT